MDAPDDGTLLDGRYRLGALLGSGGMGSVYRARDEAMGRDVAVKVPHALPGAPIWASRFLLEARLMRQIHHEHVVRVLAASRTADDPDRVYLVMELVEGVSLSGLLASEALDVRARMGLLLQVLAALVHVHARGTVHLDLKPANVLVERRRTGELRVKLTDFGLAAALEEARSDDPDEWMGTPAYMAPEQLDDLLGEIGPATDLYAVGVIAYQLLSGRRPFEGAAHAIFGGKVLRDAPPLEAAGLPAGLADVVMRLLARHPDERFAFATDVVGHLAPFAEVPRLSLDAWNAAGGGDATTRSIAATARPAERWWRRGEEAHLDELAAAAEAGRGAVALLEGPAGAGKSSLVERLARAGTTEARFRVLRCEMALSAPDAGLRGLAERLLSTRGHRDAEAVRERVRAVMAAHGGASADTVEDLCELVRPSGTTPEGALAREQRHIAIAIDLLRRLARSRPILLVLDDIHRGSAHGAAILDALVVGLATEPAAILVLAAAREGAGDPSFLDRLHAVRARPSLHHVALSPLSDEVLVPGLMSDFGLSWEEATDAARTSGGNPLFARLLAERLRAHPRARSPETVIEHTLDERLARTGRPGVARDLVERLAVLGVEVSVRGFQDFLGDEAAALLPWLDELLTVGLLRGEPGGTVRFDHALVREAALSRMDPARRRALHLAAARYSEGASEDAAAIGEHYRRAGEAAAAVPWLRRAMTRALRHGEPAQARLHGREALELTGGDDADLAVTVGRLCRQQGYNDEARRWLEPLARSDDPDHALVAIELLAEIHQERGEAQAWDDILAGVDPRAAAASPRGRAAGIRALLFWLHNHLGDPGTRDRLARVAGEGQALLEETDDEDGFALITRLWWSLSFLGRPAEAILLAERGLTLAGPRPDRRAEALRLLAKSYIARDDRARGRAQLEAALALTRRCGNLAREATTLSDLAIGWLLDGGHAEALEHADAAERLARSMGLVNEGIRARFLRSSAAVHLDEPPSADELWRLRADAEAAGIGLAAQIDMLRGVALLAEARAREAVELVATLELARLPFNAWSGLGAVELAEALARPGELEAARRDAARLLARWVFDGAERLRMAELARRATAVLAIAAPEGSGDR
ncbi:MAG: protein kinase [Sandaracinaceae bacterium]|nr:protein kinase [Sandaracinaceae bacterium]